ncbi:MAG: hypothetical protein AAGK74_09000, partial [Chloroflexota bacterium]
MAESTFDNRTSAVHKIWEDNRWLYLLMGFSLGVLVVPAMQMVNSDTIELLTGLVPEAVGIVFTVLIIERVSHRREVKRRREETLSRIIREMRSPDADEGMKAVYEARERGFLENGALQHARL